MLITPTKALAGGPRSLACRPRAPRPPERARRGAGRALPARVCRSRHLRGSHARPRAPPRTKACGSGAAARGSPRRGCTCRVLGGCRRVCLGTDCDMRERGERAPSCPLQFSAAPRTDAQRFGLKPSTTVAVPACSGNRARPVRIRVTGSVITGLGLWLRLSRPRSSAELFDSQGCRDRSVPDDLFVIPSARTDLSLATCCHRWAAPPAGSPAPLCAAVAAATSATFASSSCAKLPSPRTPVPAAPANSPPAESVGCLCRASRRRSLGWRAAQKHRPLPAPLPARGAAHKGRACRAGGGGAGRVPVRAQVRPRRRR